MHAIVPMTPASLHWWSFQIGRVLMHHLCPLYICNTIWFTFSACYISATPTDTHSLPATYLQHHLIHILCLLHICNTIWYTFPACYISTTPSDTPSLLPIYLQNHSCLKPLCGLSHNVGMTTLYKALCRYWNHAYLAVSAAGSISVSMLGCSLSVTKQWCLGGTQLQCL